MTDRQFVIATAGHVDHGKSALVKALTGTDPDRLPEEKARQITIDLGFAHLDLASPEGTSFRIAIIDVPGHEDFIRNMIAGVGSIDLALLVVAADDGWMPQTEEHLQILSYLGINRAVVAVTKTDLGNFDKTVADIRVNLQDTPFSQSPIVPTSVHAGTGLTELKDALALQLASAPSRSNVGKPRLFVDRAFSLRGIGTIATGTLTGGKLHRGEDVIVQPRNLEARIRSVQSYGIDVEEAQPGMRTAVNLPDLAIGESGDALKRGDVVTTRALSPSATLDVLLRTSSRQRKKDSGPRLLKSGASIDVHHGTARVAAKVILWSDSLKPGEQTIAELRLDSPIFAFLGDRFVIRDRSQQYTLAGGIVLDPDAERARFRTKAQRTFLTTRAEAGNDLEAYVSSEIQRAGAVPVSKLLLKSLFRAEEIRAAVERLQRNGDAVMRENIAADPAAWRSWQARAAALIDEGHAKNPQHAGLDLSSLRAAIPDHTPDVFEALLSDLCADGFCRRGQIIARLTHQPALTVPLEAVAKLILQALADKPFDPPTPKQLAPEKRSHQALKFLIENGTVAEISSDLVLLRASLEQMQSTIENFIKSHGPATVSELRQELQTSRRIMVPLLEYLDRRGVTSRAGDRRRLAH